MGGVVALLAGLLFGVGLLLAGMSDPAKVLAFLDIGGRWDPSLALVMLAALGVALLPMRRATGRMRSLLGTPMQLPTRRDIDAPLLLGSLAFGAGWGLSGLCPGPALVLLGSGQGQVLPFMGALLAGMALYSALQKWRAYRAGER